MAPTRTIDDMMIPLFDRDQPACVVFHTSTTFDPNSFKVMGLHSKPNSNSPIGYFGTGLKLAIACIVRNGGSVVIITGKMRYEFYTKKTKFRDTEAEVIMVKSKSADVWPLGRWKYEQLAYTTNFARDWDMWQAVRELESNTRDEQGYSTLKTAADIEDNYDQHTMNAQNSTAIIITHPDFNDAYLQLDEIFLPDGMREPTSETPTLQIIDRPSKHIYWRGMRVYDLPEETPSEMTYNFVTFMELTEDRTLKHPFIAQMWAAQEIAESTDTEMIRKILKASGQTAKNKVRWESKMDWEYAQGRAIPSSEFITQIAISIANSIPFHGSISGIYDSHIEREQDKSYKPKFTTSQIVAEMRRILLECPDITKPEDTNSYLQIGQLREDLIRDIIHYMKQ